VVANELPEDFVVGHASTVRNAYESVKSSVTLFYIAVSDAYRVVTDTKLVVSLTREGKRLLRAAQDETGVSYSELGRIIGRTHVHVRALLGDEETLRYKTNPTWSSPDIPKLCQALGVPLWAVSVSGLRPEHLRILDALERLREHAPDRYDAFVEQIVEQADDKAVRAGWNPEEPPTPRGRRRPTLRTVR
jgi:hypothetical protein